MRLCIIGFYFGPLPNSMPMTLKSMGTNKDVDWILFTDHAIQDKPDNLRNEVLSFEEFSSSLQSKFDFPLIIHRPYKIADVRPAFGYIFSDIIQQYDFWGCCDFDVIFGSIADILTEETLVAHQKILLRGAFTLYRNSPSVNTWFLEEGHGLTFREAMARPSIQYWDEWEGINRIARGLEASIWDGTDVTFDISTHHYLPRSNYASTKSPTFYWENGHLYEQGRNGMVREGLYMHLQKRPLQTPSPRLEQANKFYIYGNRFTSEREPRLSLKDVAGSLEFRLARLNKSARR